MPFDAFKTFQVPIKEVERLTQLSFMGGPSTKPVSLTTVDPLATRPVKRAARVGLKEAASVNVPDGWLQLDALEAMVLPD